MNPHRVTEEFESRLADYTGAPYAVALDNASNALFLALVRHNVKGRVITIPNHTYMSVPCEVIHAGGIVNFRDTHSKTITGAYRLEGSNVIDSALRFTGMMYEEGTSMCCSFTGPYKHLKLGKGGCILTDSHDDYEWFKRARYSGRRAVSYHDDYFDMLGWNFYMNPMIASLGLLLMQNFYNLDGTRKVMDDITLPYPDLSKYPIYVSK